MNRWYFWVLAPVFILTAIIIPLVAEPPSIGGRILVWIMVAALLLGTLGLANPIRFCWALRSVAAAIVLAGLAYVGTELVWWLNGKPFNAFGHSLLNAVLFLFVFGLPALRYLLTGRSGTDADVIAAPEALDANAVRQDSQVDR